MLHVFVCFCAFIMMWYFQLPRLFFLNQVLWDFSLMLLYMNTYCIKMLLYKKCLSNSFSQVIPSSQSFSNHSFTDKA